MAIAMSMVMFLVTAIEAVLAIAIMMLMVLGKEQR